MLVKNGNKHYFAHVSGEQIEMIEPGTYTICFHPDIGVYLETSQNLTPPKRIYGSTSIDRADRIRETYLSRENKNTGVLLSGNKGAGKSNLVKLLSQTLIEEDNLIVVIINSDVKDYMSELSVFLSGITQRMMVVIDEFDKKFKKQEEQEEFLSILDGGNGTDNLFVLTTNTNKVSEFLLNRPGRIFYHYRYTKITREEVDAFLADTLENKEHYQNITQLWDICSDFSFDVMSSLVEELNRYPDIEFSETLATLNIEVASSSQSFYDVQLASLNGKDQAGWRLADPVNLYDWITGTDELRVVVCANREATVTLNRLRNPGFRLSGTWSEDDYEDEKPNYTFDYSVYFGYSPENCSVSDDLITIKVENGNDVMVVELSRRKERSAYSAFSWK